MKRTIPSTILAALLLFLGARTFSHLPDVVPWGPPILAADLLRIPPRAATTILFLIDALYGIALLTTAYALFRLRSWAASAYLSAAGLFATNYLCIIGLVRNQMVVTGVMVFLVLFVPCIWLGWWIIGRQFRQNREASSAQPESVGVAKVTEP